MGAPPPPPHYPLPSSPLLLPGCHRNQPARSRPAPRRGGHPVSFPGSPEPAPRSGLVLFRTLRDTRLWWRSQEPTGSELGLPRPCGSDLLLIAARRALGASQTSAPRNTHEPAPVPATLRASPGRTASNPRRPPDRGKRVGGSWPAPGSRQPCHPQAMWLERGTSPRQQVLVSGGGEVGLGED